MACTELTAYLRLVYPTNEPTDCAQAEALFRRSWYVYHTEHDDAVLPLLSGRLMNHNSHDCEDGFYQTMKAAGPQVDFAGLLPCGSGMRGCIRRQATYAPAWGVASQRYVEVWHLGYNSWRGDLHGARVPALHAIDGEGRGPSPFWYRFAPGSGIWYDCGERMLTSSSKGGALLQLVDEWHATGRHDADTAARLASSIDGGTLWFLGEADFAARLRRLVRGDARCDEVRVPNCRQDFILGDEWDVATLQLGRALGYDTLFITAAMLLVANEATSQLVDLRLPAAMAARRSFLAREIDDDRGAKDVLRELAASGRLSLRDPLALGDAARARPCALVWSTIRWHCAGHVSERAADESKHSAHCVRKGAMLPWPPPLPSPPPPLSPSPPVQAPRVLLSPPPSPPPPSPSPSPSPSPPPPLPQPPPPLPPTTHQHHEAEPSQQHSSLRPPPPPPPKPSPPSPSPPTPSPDARAASSEAPPPPEPAVTSRLSTLVEAALGALQRPSDEAAGDTSHQESVDEIWFEALAMVAAICGCVLVLLVPACCAHCCCPKPAATRTRSDFEFF